MLKKIVIIGPESTGKSTLSEMLAKKFNTYWVPEYAREYLLEHGTNYRFEDLRKIREGQLALEEQFSRQALEERKKLLFIDTDMQVIRVWSEFVFNQCDSRTLNEIVARNYDLYLLCNTDLPWVKDELREYPDETTRIKLFHHYKDAMINQDTPWAEIRGGYQNRLPCAVKAIEDLLGIVD